MVHTHTIAGWTRSRDERKQRSWYTHLKHLYIPLSEHGNKYVLMIIDQFTRWLEMVPLHFEDANLVARAFYENYVVRWGVPFLIHTDQEQNFESTLFHSFCRLLKAVKSRTTPYRPSANGQIERYNQLVLNFLCCFLGKHQQDWEVSTSFGHEYLLHGQQEHWFHC